MATSNEQIFDAMVRQQVNLQRLSKGEVNKMLRELKRADKELNTLLKQRLKSGMPPDFTSRRYQAMIKEIGRQRSAVMKAIGGQVTNTMGAVTKVELAATDAILSRAVPIELNFAQPNLGIVQELSRNRPFGTADMAQTIGEWFVNLQEAEMGRINGALQAGLTNGETADQIRRRVMKATDMTRNQADAVARTGINHAANTARQEFFSENDDVITALRWTATLDGRTSAICRARDGHYDAVEPGGDMEGVPNPHITGSPRRPPAHPRCRSLMTAMLDSDSIADQMPERPFVRDTRTRRQREIDFRKQAKEKTGSEAWSRMDRKQRNAMIRDERRDWTRKNVGTVPGDVDYDTWLRRQPPEFQDEVLGKTKGEAFRKGVKTDQYVDRDGNELTIDQMRAKMPDKFPAEPDTMTAQQELERATKAAEKQAARQAELVTAKQATADRKAATAQRRADKAERARDAAQERADRRKVALDDETAKRKAAEQQRRAAEAEAKRAREAQLDADRRLRTTRDQNPNPVNAENQQRVEIMRDEAFQDVARQKGRKSIYDMTPEERGEARDLLWKRIRNTVPPGEDTLRYRQWLDTLSDDDFEILAHWGAHPGDFRSIQRGDWDPKLSKLTGVEAQRRVDRLQEILDAGPQYEGQHLYRGLGLDKEDLDRLQVGDAFAEGAFSSYSYDPSTAAEFAQLAAQKKGGPDQLVILKTEGPVPAVTVQNLTDPGGHIAFEAEAIMSPDAAFTVTNVQRAGDFWEVTIRGE